MNDYQRGAADMRRRIIEALHGKCLSLHRSNRFKLELQPTSTGYTDTSVQTIINVIKELPEPRG